MLNADEIHRGRAALDNKQTIMIVLSLVCLLIYMPTNMSNVYLTKIAQQYSFNDSQRDSYLGGWMSAAIMVGQIIGTLSSGYLVSGGGNKKIKRLTLLVLLLCCSGTLIFLYINSSFYTLLILRLIIGLAQGGIVPIVFAIVADLYPPSERPSASAGK